MFRSLSKSLTATISVLILLGSAITATAQNESADTDTVSIDSDGGSVNIRIDQHGVSVQGALEDGDTLAGGRIIFNGRGSGYKESGTEIVKFGEDLWIGPGELIRGDVVVFGGDVTIEGKVVGNVVVMAGDGDLRDGSEVTGDVVVLGGTLREEGYAQVHGEKVMMKDLSIPVQGFSHFFGSHARFFSFFFVPIQFFISIVLSFIIILFMRERVEKMQTHVQHSFLKSFGAGFLAIFAGIFVVSFLAVILVITIIGIPLAFVLLVSCVAIFILSRTVFVFALGIKINEKLNVQTTNPFAVVLIGTAALYLPALLGHAFTILPFGDPIGAVLKGLGFLISCFAYLVGVGALFLSRMGVREALPEPSPTASPAPQPE